MVTLYRNGRVRTLERPGATAFVVDGAALAWFGTEDDVPRHLDGVDEVIDLDGALVLPAFVDAHVHLSHTGLGLRGVDLGPSRTIGAALALLESAARVGRGRPIFAFNWEEQSWAERRALTAAELDRASFGGVVYAARIDSHSAVISSALALASGASTLDGWLGDGLVVRAAKNAAREAFDAARSSGQRLADIEAALTRAAAQGIAAVHECGGPLLTSAEDFADCLALGRRPGSPQVVGYWAEAATDPDHARSLIASHGAAGLAGDLNMDGSIGSRTAHLRSEYTDAPGHTGTAFRTADEVAEHVAACAVAGVQSGFHVIGDAGVDAVLDGYEEAARRVGIHAVRDSRPRLEHVEMIDGAGVARLDRLGLTASVQPAFDAAWGGSTGMYADRLGPARVRGMNPLRAMVAAGVPVALGSDSPVTPFDPWAAIAASVLHHDPSERLEPGVAFHAHTVGGWRAARDDIGGELRVGAPATFAAWDGPIEDLGGLPNPTEPPVCRVTVREGVRLDGPGGE